MMGHFPIRTRILFGGSILFVLGVVFAAYYYSIKAASEALSREDVRHWFNQPVSNLKVWQFVAILVVFACIIVGGSKKE